MVALFVSSLYYMIATYLINPPNESKQRLMLNSDGVELALCILYAL